MANLILANTTGEICCEIQQSYLRLVGNYVGPLKTSTASTSGFLIRDANNNSGLYVANCAIQTCKNKIEYIDTASSNPAYIILPADKCLHISGNNSVFSFSNAGNFSAGSGIYSVFNGIQSFSSSPSFTLIPNATTINNAFRSLNCSCQVQFYICQTGNSGVFLSGSNAFRFDNLNRQGAYYISGNSTSVSGLPLSDYSFANYGCSNFKNTSVFDGNSTINATGCFKGSHIGLDVDTCSTFKKLSTFCENLCICLQKTICSNGTACFTTGYFSCLTGITDIFGTNAVFTSFTGFGTSCLCILNASKISANTGCFCRIDGLNSNLLICNYTNLCLNGNASNSVYNFGSFCNSGSFCNFGSFSNLGQGIFSCIRTTGTSTSCNILSGCMFVTNDACISGNLCSWSVISGASLISSGLICGSRISGASITGQTICQMNASTITCFLSTGLHLSQDFAGHVKAVNTAKAWGRIMVVDGVSTQVNGYNVKSHQVYSTAAGTASAPAASTIYAHGICFTEPIKYPFSINFNVYPIGHPVITGHNANTQLGQQLGFSGNVSTTTLGISGASNPQNTSNWGAIFYALSGKNSSNNLAAYAVGTCYSEIYFNLHNQKGPFTPLSEITGATSDAIINFTIFGA